MYIGSKYLPKSSRCLVLLASLFLVACTTRPSSLEQKKSQKIMKEAQFRMMLTQMQIEASRNQKKTGK